MSPRRARRGRLLSAQLSLLHREPQGIPKVRKSPSRAANRLVLCLGGDGEFSVDIGRGLTTCLSGARAMLASVPRDVEPQADRHGPVVARRRHPADVTGRCHSPDAARSAAPETGVGCAWVNEAPSGRGPAHWTVGRHTRRARNAPPLKRIGVCVVLRDGRIGHLGALDVGLDRR